MNDTTYPGDTYDVAVIGAGAAGLQAALTLGRMNRSTVVLGTDRYRNDPASAMHNFLGHDGTPPAALRTAARADLDRYATVAMVETGAATVERGDDRFVVRTTEGRSFTVRRVVLAMGVADTLPQVPGLAELWGDLVAHCPYCHGHEFSGEPVGLLGADASLPLRAALLERIASRRVVLTDGADLDPDVADALKRMDVEVRSEPLLEVRRSDAGLSVALEGAEPLELGGLFVHTSWAPTAPFAEQLGLDRAPTGAIAVDGLGRTSRPGVYAVGDVAQPVGLPMPMSSVLVAAASGQVAAATADRELAAEDNGIPLPF